MAQDVLAQWFRSLFGFVAPAPQRRRLSFVPPVTTGTSLPFLGQTLTIQVHQRPGRSLLERRGNTLLVGIGAEVTSDQLQKLVEDWYRKKFKALIPELLARWEPVVGVHAEAWGVKQMKTRWGTCNPRDKRIWLNLELAKKNQDVVEYVLVHELVHLLEPSHNSRFKALMTRFYPRWKEVQRGLKGIS